MDTFFSIVIFILLFVFYIHIIAHYKKGEDLEIYEMDYTNNNELQKVCSMNQPILFSLHFSSNIDNSKRATGSLLLDSQITKTVTPDILRYYDKIYVKVFDVNDYYKEDAEKENLKYIYMPYSSYHILMKTDPRSRYFIQQNDEFMEETNFNYKMSDIIDPILKPNYAVIVNTTYDICTGSKEIQLPFRYHNYYRRFYIVAKGKIHVKMTPYKNSRYLDPMYDINTHEYYSPYNVWKSTAGTGDKKDGIVNEDHIFENVPFIEFDVLEGNVLYIPSYWWYSFKFSSSDSETILVSATYHSIMNVTAHSPEWIRFYSHQKRTNDEFRKKRLIKKSTIDNVTDSTLEKEQFDKETFETKTALVEAIPDTSDDKKMKITTYLQNKMNGEDII